MSINVEHRRLGGEMIPPSLQALSGPALDDIWKESWLREGIGSGLTDLVKKLELGAGALRHRCDRILLVAEGMAADMLQAMLPLDRDGKVRLVRGTLSAEVLSQILEDLEGRSAGLIAVALTPESPAFCAVFATLRKYLAGRYPGEKTQRMKAIFASESTYLREEAERGDMESFEVSGGSVPGDEASGGGPLQMAAGTALLYPMLAAGADAAAYVRGFREILTSTWWDQDADRYGLLLGEKALARGEALPAGEEILFWQPKMEGLCRWIAAARREMGTPAAALYLPRDKALCRQKAGKVLVFCQEEEADVLLPVFPGASPEGSLHEMTKEAAEALFREEGESMLTLEKLDAAELGRMMAYLQLSFAIAGRVAGSEEK